VIRSVQAPLRTLLNPDGDIPDIDCASARPPEEVIAYVQRTYGTETSPSSSRRDVKPGAVRDVEVLEMPYAEVDRNAKMIRQISNDGAGCPEGGTRFREMIARTRRSPDLFRSGRDRGRNRMRGPTLGGGDRESPITDFSPLIQAGHRRDHDAVRDGPTARWVSSSSTSSACAP